MVIFYKQKTFLQNRKPTFGRLSFGMWLIWAAAEQGAMELPPALIHAVAPEVRTRWANRLWVQRAAWTRAWLLDCDHSPAVWLSQVAFPLSASVSWLPGVSQLCSISLRNVWLYFSIPTFKYLPRDLQARVPGKTLHGFSTACCPRQHWENCWGFFSSWLHLPLTLLKTGIKTLDSCLPHKTFKSNIPITFS